MLRKTHKNKNGQHWPPQGDSFQTENVTDNTSCSCWTDEPRSHKIVFNWLDASTSAIMAAWNLLWANCWVYLLFSTVPSGTLLALSLLSSLTISRLVTILGRLYIKHSVLSLLDKNPTHHSPHWTPCCWKCCWSPFAAFLALAWCWSVQQCNTTIYLCLCGSHLQSE